MAEASALAARLAAGPTRGLGLTKRAIQAAAANSLDAHLDLERDLQRAGRAHRRLCRRRHRLPGEAQAGVHGTMTHAALSPQELAEACAAGDVGRTTAPRSGSGMHLEHVAPGEATLAMTVTDSMMNGHGTGHGGFIFALADSAFAFACNSYNQRTVAPPGGDYLHRPGPPGRPADRRRRARSRAEAGPASTMCTSPTRRASMWRSSAATRAPSREPTCRSDRHRMNELEGGNPWKTC